MLIFSKLLSELIMEKSKESNAILLSFEFVPPLMGQEQVRRQRFFAVIGICSIPNGAKISKEDHAFCVNKTGSNLNGARKGKEDYTLCCQWNWFQPK
jgi:hypothetical protein